MKTPQLPQRHRFSRITASGVFFALTLCGAALYAATQASPIILLEVSKKDIAPDSGGGSGGGSSSGGGWSHGGGGGGGGSSSTNDVIYTVKVSNASTVPSGTLSMEYHIYMKSTSSDNGAASTTVSDTTGSQDVTVDPKSSKDIALPAVQHKTTTTAGSSSKDKKSGTIKTVGGSSTSSGPMGVYVVLKNGDKVIAEQEEPMGVKKQADQAFERQNRGK